MASARSQSGSAALPCEEAGRHGIAGRHAAGGKVDLDDVEDADFFRLRLPKGPSFVLDKVTNFRSFGSRWLKDRTIDGLASETF